MFRSAIRLVQQASRLSALATRIQPNHAVAVCMVPKKSFSTEVASYADEDAAWVSFFDNEELDYVDFTVGFMKLYTEDNVPEPTILRSALYATRRINNLPLAMRVLEMIRVKCIQRKDIYDYLMQELQPTLDDLGLKRLEEYELDKVTSTS